MELSEMIVDWGPDTAAEIRAKAWLAYLQECYRKEAEPHLEVLKSERARKIPKIIIAPSSCVSGYWKEA